MRNRRAGLTEGSSCAIQELVAITESDKRDQSTTIVLLKQPILCSSGSTPNNVQKDQTHLNDLRSHSPPPNTSSVEEPQVGSRSRSAHLGQKADHLVVSGDHGNIWSPSYSPVTPIKDLTIDDDSRHLFPASTLGQDKSSDTCFSEQAHLAYHGPTAMQQRPASPCQSGLLTGSNPGPLPYSKCQARVVTNEDREDDVWYNVIPQPVEPPLHPLYLGSQWLLQEREFSNRFHHFSCRCLVTGS
jgi:hypothetical protein